MGILVSKFFSNSFNLVSATVTRKSGQNLDEAAIYILYKIQRIARYYVNPEEAYVVVFTTQKGSEKIPLRHFIPNPITQYDEADEMEFLTYNDEEPPQWQLDAMNIAAHAMECSMNDALMAAMNAIIHAVLIGAVMDVE